MLKSLPGAAGAPLWMQVRLGQLKHLPRKLARLTGPGELMSLLIAVQETDGTFFMVDIFVAPDGGTPPRIHHREDESIHLLESALTVQVGGIQSPHSKVA